MNVYDTFSQITERKKVAKVIEAFRVNQAMRSSDFIQTSETKGNATIFKVAPGIGNIPQWNLPIVDGNGATLIDTRMFERADGRVTKGYEVQYLLNRAMLCSEWAYNPEGFEALLDPLTIYYAEWLSNLISGRFAINASQLMTYRLIFAFYYWHAIMGSRNIEMMTKDDIMVIFGRFAERKMNIARQSVNEVITSDPFLDLADKINKQGEPIHINHFFSAGNAIVDSVAISIDLASIYEFAFARSNRSWFGEASIDIASSAIEFPPMFAHMAYIAATRSTHKNTYVGQAVDFASKRYIKPDGLVRWMNITADDYGIAI